MKALWLCYGLAACGGTDALPATATDAASDAHGDALAGCALTASTSPSGQRAPSGCEVLLRDTSDCRAARTAAGLAGVWLAFSCRVQLSASGTATTTVSDGLPDFPSNYFSASDPCHEAYTGAIQNPNSIATKHYTVEFPRAPDTTARTMQMTASVLLLRRRAIRLTTHWQRN